MDLKGDGGSGTVNIAFFDGSTFQLIKVGITATTAGVAIGAYGAVSDVEVLSLPILLTNSLYWVVFETGGAQNVDVVYSFQKVSL